MIGIRKCSGSRPRRFRIVDLVALLAILAATGGPLITLCLGDDGHVALELMVAGSCTPDDVAVDASSFANRTFASLNGQDPCCGPCTDLPGPLKQCVGSAGSFESGYAPALFLAASTTSPSLSDIAAVAHRAAAASTSLYQYPAHSTAVLLC